MLQMRKKYFFKAPRRVEKFREIEKGKFPVTTLYHYPRHAATDTQKQQPAR